MNLLDQIRNLKQWESADNVENPLPQIETVLRQVQAKRCEVMTERGISWAELIDASRAVDPALTDAVLALWDEIDPGIYGRYIQGSLTSEVLQDYYNKLDEWKRLSLQMFNLINEPR